MSHFGDFMDGVPVKISEKYKKPRSKELPYSVTECSVRARAVVESVKYCSTFEKNVLSKLQELRSAKETKKNERRHRLQLLQEAKQKKLDAIAAAEAEEKLKQLSVSEVSYPSTDEISALSLDEKAEQPCETPKQDSPEVTELTNMDMTYPTNSSALENPPPNILQPIQVQASYNQNSLLDDPDPLQELKMTAKISKMPQYSNIDMLTYKDFENDTSSPFDNVELKTINDMELLAQVLQSQRDSGTSCHTNNYAQETYSNIPNCATQAQAEGMGYLPNSYVEQPIQGQSVMYLPQHYPVSNGYYVPAESACDNPMPMDNVNMYMPNYQYYVPTNPYPTVDPTYYNPQLPTTSGEVNQLPNGSTFIPQPYYFQIPQVPYSAENTTYNSPKEQAAHNIDSQNQNLSMNSQNAMKSRSRSVPDIVRELNEELASAKLRSNERSCTTSPAPKNVPRSSSSSDKKEEKRSRRKERLPNPFEKLPPTLQGMCQKIHGMGFPLDRVARVCGLLGENDKKVIEGLLILGELMDLGFTEGRVLTALAKHAFNRDKALDELVS